MFSFLTCGKDVKQFLEKYGTQEVEENHPEDVLDQKAVDNVHNKDLEQIKQARIRALKNRKTQNDKLKGAGGNLTENSEEESDQPVPELDSDEKYENELFEVLGFDSDDHENYELNKDGVYVLQEEDKMDKEIQEEINNSHNSMREVKVQVEAQGETATQMRKSIIMAGHSHADAPEYNTNDHQQVFMNKNPMKNQGGQRAYDNTKKHLESEPIHGEDTDSSKDNTSEIIQEGPGRNRQEVKPEGSIKPITGKVEEGRPAEAIVYPSTASFTLKRPQFGGKSSSRGDKSRPGLPEAIDNDISAPVDLGDSNDFDQLQKRKKQKSASLSKR